MSELNDRGRVQAPAVVYHSLDGGYLDLSFETVLGNLQLKDLYVLQGLLNQASMALHTEIHSRRPAPGYPAAEPF